LEILGVLGRIYVGFEGINAQISVPTENFEALKNYLYSIEFLNGIRLNIAVDDDGKSFFALDIKVRNKIVADGLNDATFDVTNKGIHLKAAEFNALASQPDTVIVDMRNHYEHEVGHFENAILPDVDTFRQSLPIVEEILEPNRDKQILLYCTGGIRCEKASAYFKHKGFKNVYQLEGGIIEYARQVKSQGLENKFKGKNFVFDERLGERISEEIVAHCHQCGELCDTHTNCANDGCHLLFIQCPKCKEKFEGCCSTECKETLHLPIEKQRELRKGVNKGRQVFRKGRVENSSLEKY
ncbi:MAG: rhodanese-related sulfurtransferase, partial [Chitinophagales bacterium]|nr:rhodanese-related sulfurtransferase [Chitinophagales bacterium]